MKIITKSQLRKMIRQAVLQEQLGSASREEDPGILIDEIEDGLKDVQAQIAEEVKTLTSRLDFLSTMIRALDSTDFGGSVEHGSGMSNPHRILEAGASKLSGTFGSYGHDDLSDKIKKLLELTL